MVSNLKVSSSTQYSETDLYQKAANEKWAGNGTYEKPFIIESTHSLANKSIIKNTSLHILIRKCEFDVLSFKKCKNIKIEGCTFDVLGLSKCSEIKVKNCSFSHSLEVRYGHNLEIQDSHIPFLIFSMCYEIHFKRCTIMNLYNHFSRANIFENINAPEGINNILRGSLKKYYTKYLGLIAVGVISLFSAIIMYFNSSADSVIWSFVGGLFLLAFITFIGAVALYHDYREMKHYPDNRIYEKSSEI
ncbi:hypothetical protein LCGC14_1773890 [marine sediment metagenome]|uniref:Right handed beta helix domain-containing protein n=1 Tax=marine sediment metagenome TaxID=412755 RepID=A0A0F9JCC8_9ZZZZ